MSIKRIFKQIPRTSALGLLLIPLIALTYLAIQQSPLTQPPSALYVDGSILRETATKNQVTLHGFRIPGFLHSKTGGEWYDAYGTFINIWDTGGREAFRQNIEIMKSWKCNFIRTFLEWDAWIQNTRDESGAPYRHIIEDVTQICLDNDVFVMFSWWDTVLQSQPPWDYVGGWTTWVNGWRSFTDVMDQYPNTLYQLWNEPVVEGYDGNIPYNDYMNGCRDTISALREFTDHILCINVAWGVGYTEDAAGNVIWRRRHPEWIFDPRIQGPNIMYDLHAYEQARGRVKEADGNYTYFTEYADIRRAFLDQGVINSSKCVLIGEWAPVKETGGVHCYTESAYTAAWNEFNLLHEYHTHYAIQLWSPWYPCEDSTFRVTGDKVDFTQENTFTPWGLLCRDALLGYSPPAPES